jgi:beta-glucanase (GH16 family)
MIYKGSLPEETRPKPERSPGEEMWRNVALTLVVVVAIAVGAAVIFRKRSDPSQTTWATPTASATASPSPTDALRYQGPPPSGESMPVGDLPGWRQTFVEDFNGADLSQRWFLYDGQPNGDPGGWFLPSHVSQTGGRLIINASPTQTPNGNIYATGGLSNSKSFSQVYGKFSIRFRIDKGYGINYIVMLWPADDSWPPEINIAEDNGLRRDLITSTLHYGGHGSEVKRISHNQTGLDFTQWHTVGLEWTPGKLVMYLDGHEWSRTESSAVPSVPMSIALQSQAWFCGGSFSDCPNNTTPKNVNMEVDWAVAYAMG